MFAELTSLIVIGAAPAGATIEIASDGQLGPVLLAAPTTADLQHSFWDNSTQVTGG